MAFIIMNNGPAHGPPAKRAAGRGLRTAAKALWRWLTKPSTAYPQPPHPDEDNARGLGWGSHEKVRPFNEGER